MALEAFAGQPQHNVLALSIQPMYAARLSGYGMRVNFEGAICIGSGSPTPAYTQVFRNGVIEAVRVGVLGGGERTPDPDLIPSLAFEDALVSYVPHCFEILTALGCNPPVVIGISLIGVKGQKMALDFRQQMAMGASGEINRDVLVLPEILVEDLSKRVGPLLKPALDLVWNACGYDGSVYFDQDRNWIGR
jgi:hypothetical protein